MSKSYEDLIVWQKAVDLSAELYAITKSFPKEEIYGITNQIRRSGVSIASNIAEGNCRLSKKDFSHFLAITLGSIAELKTQIIIANKIGFLTDIAKEAIISKINEIDRMTKALLNSLKTN
jgi:four helix bundle protein